MSESTNPPLTTLVASSDNQQRHLICKALEPFHLELVEAEDAEQTHELFQEIQPSIVVLSEHLGSSSGLDYCREITTNRGECFTPILAVLDSATHEKLDYVSEVGATDYIVEPIHPESLRRRFSCLLRRLHTDQFLLQSHKQLLEQKRMETIGLFATGMAHNFNNIFASIMATTELLRVTCGEMPQIQQAVQTIAHATYRGAELTSSLVSFSAMASPTRTIDCAEPGEVLAEIVNLFSRMDRIGAHYILDAPDDLPTVRVSTADFSRVLLELFRNASKAIPHGGKVTTTVDVQTDLPRNSRFLRVIIQDNGRGIPSNKLDNLFVPFYQVQTEDPSLQIALDGAGMGLSTCYNILSSVGGSIQIDQTTESGTSISFTVPIVDD
jgi:signal transduction histidine kinase